MRLLLNGNLSDSDRDFFNNLNLYFPIFYDIKFLINEYESIKNLGLGDLANELKVYILI